MSPEGVRPLWVVRGLTPWVFTVFLSTVWAEAPPAPALTTEVQDTNQDGRPDLWLTRDGTRPVRLERDRNGDGTPDVWGVYTYPAQDQSQLAVTVDRNGDGRLDYWRLERNRVPVREWGDLNDDGRVDYWVTYAPDSRAKQWAVMDKNGDGRPDAWFHYGADGTRPDAGERDEDFDGVMEKIFGTLPAERPTLDEPPTVDVRRAP